MEGLHQDIVGNLVMFAALLLSAHKTPRRSFFRARFLSGLVIFTLLRYGYTAYLSALIPQSAARPAAMVFFTSFIPLTAAAALFCWDMDPWAALYCGSSAYCLQHILNKGYDLVRSFFLTGARRPAFYAAYIALSLAVLLAYALVATRQRISRIRVDSKLLLLLSMLVIVTAVMLDLQARSAIRGAQPEAFYIVNWYSIIAVFIILGFQLMLVSSKDKEMELSALRSLLEEQAEQYRFEKSIIDTLNIRAHDIKHQMLHAESANRESLPGEGGELSQLLSAYDARFRTENPALDVILTRKSFVCHEKHIDMTAMAEGAALSFMREADIYALFGNILDNAIEAADKLEEERKVIKLSVEKRGYFVNIHEENYFSQKLEFEDGLPRTTKPDAAYHGFGMKSIRMIAQRYDGSVKISTEGNRFMLDLFFPV